MLFQFAWRSLQRNPIRSFLTGSMITIGTSLLIIGVSWIFGIQSSVINTMIQANGKIRITTVAFAQKELQLPIAENIVNTERITTLLSQEASINAIYTRLAQPVIWFREGEKQQENIAIFTGISAEYYQEQLQIKTKLLDGSIFQNKEEIIIGKTLAKKQQLFLGDALFLFGQTQDGSISSMKMKIVGIADFGNPAQNQNIFGSLSAAQWMADIPKGGTEILIYSEESGQSIARLMQEKYPFLPEESQTIDRNGVPAPFSILSWDQREPFHSLLPILFFFDICLVSSIILVTALGILNTMIMSLLERKKELGVLRALGASRFTISKIIFLETLILAGIAGGFGVLFGSLIALGMESIGVPLGAALSGTGNILAADIVYPDWRIEISIFGLFLSFLMGLLGTIFPLYHLFRSPIIDSIRAE